MDIYLIESTGCRREYSCASGTSSDVSACKLLHDETKMAMSLRRNKSCLNVPKFLRFGDDHKSVERRERDCLQSFCGRSNHCLRTKYRLSAYGRAYALPSFLFDGSMFVLYGRRREGTMTRVSKDEKKPCPFLFYSVLLEAFGRRIGFCPSKTRNGVSPKFLRTIKELSSDEDYSVRIWGSRKAPPFFIP